MSTSKFVRNSIVRAGIASLVSVVGSMAIGVTPSKAATIDFDSITWTTVGDATSSSGQVNMSTNALNSEDLPQADTVFSVTDTVPTVQAGIVGGLEESLGLAIGDLDNINGNDPLVDPFGGFAQEGSGVTGTVTANANDVLEFNWNFSSNDTTFNDFAFIAINGGTPTILADTASASSGTYSTVLAAANPTVAIGVVDAGDFNNSSNFSAQAVPEPLTILGSLGGLAFGFLDANV